VSFVLDDSVALPWCFADEQMPAIMELLTASQRCVLRRPCCGHRRPSTVSSPPSGAVAGERSNLSNVQ
jgi:hypothetical protein